MVLLLERNLGIHWNGSWYCTPLMPGPSGDSVVTYWVVQRSMVELLQLSRLELPDDFQPLT